MKAKWLPISAAVFMALSSASAFAADANGWEFHGYGRLGGQWDGDGRHNRFFREQFGCQRLMLCHQRLTIRHPQTAAPLQIKAELDETWLQLFDQFAWR